MKIGITQRISMALERDPTLTIEEAVDIANMQEKNDKKEHVEHDWMEAEVLGMAVPMDARSSPIVEMRNGVEYRVSVPICTQGGVEVAVPAVPSDPRRRPAHIKWKAKNIITGEE